MVTALRIPAVRVWALLVLLTGSSFWLGADHGLGTARAALSLVLVVAFIKAWFVAHYFMELRHSPPALRRIVDGWLVITGGVVLGLYVAL